MPLPRFVIAMLLATAFSVAPSRADDLATAQQLFRQGKALMSEGRVEEACVKFEGAAQLSPTAGVRLNLAECWAKLGRTASAWAKYEEAETLAERAGDAPAAQLAKERRAELEPLLCYLTVAVPEYAVVQGLVVARDGHKLPQAAWNTPVPVDPGEHEVVASAPGRKTWTSTQAVTGAGVRISVTIPVLQEEGAAADGLQDAAPAGGTRRTLAIVSGGVGLIGIGVGTYFGLKAMSKQDDYEKHRGADGRCLDIECETLSEEAHDAGTLSTIGFAAGGALLATGTVLWLTAPADGESTSAGLTPVLGAQVTGLQMRGAW
jgi:hypothetical protein